MKDKKSSRSKLLLALPCFRMVANDSKIVWPLAFCSIETCVKSNELNWKNSFDLHHGFGAQCTLHTSCNAITSVCKRYLCINQSKQISEFAIFKFSNHMYLSLYYVEYEKINQRQRSVKRSLSTLINCCRGKMLAKYQNKLIWHFL